MKNPTRLEVNCETGEQTVIELTDEEVAEIAQLRIEAEQAETQRLAEAEVKSAIKASALAKLQALGLTEEEAKAIAGN